MQQKRILNQETKPKTVLTKTKCSKATIAEGSEIADPTTSKFYLRTKIHKGDPSAHPIVNSVNCNICSLVIFN